MKTIISNKQAEELIKNGVLNIDDDLEIAFDGFNIKADIKCKNIYSKNYPRNISAYDISARDISAYDILANDISAYDILANDISANDISANDISANDINYYAFCVVYNNIKCKSIKGEKNNSKHFCLDGEITIKKDNEEIIEHEGKKYKLVKE